MATIKVTFTLDQATIARLQDAATCMTMPKSEVVRAAIADYYDRIGRLSEGERLRILRILDELVTVSSGSIWIWRAGNSARSRLFSRLRPPKGGCGHDWPPSKIQTDPRPIVFCMMDTIFF